MILKSLLQDIIVSQNSSFDLQNLGTERKLLKNLSKPASHISIISGIRRCGKSTLMRQIMSQKPQQKKVFINFEDSRFSSFDSDDFDKLTSILSEKFNGAECYFDEIQNIEQWEKFVRILHDTGRSIFITGSNASLLSAELGTKLTGRYLLTTLFPFSYTEYLAFTDKPAGEKSFSHYLFKIA